MSYLSVYNLFEATAVHDAATSDRTSSASSLKNSDKSGSENKFDLSFFSTKRYQRWQLYNSLDLEASDYKNVTLCVITREATSLTQNTSLISLNARKFKSFFRNFLIQLF